MWSAVGSSGKPGEPLGLAWGCFGDTHVQPGCGSAAPPEGSERHCCGLTCSPNESLQLMVASLVKEQGVGQLSQGNAHTRAAKSITSCKFRGFQTTALPEVFTELTAVMLTVTIIAGSAERGFRCTGESSVGGREPARCRASLFVLLMESGWVAT